MHTSPYQDAWMEFRPQLSQKDPIAGDTHVDKSRPVRKLVLNPTLIFGPTVVVIAAIGAAVMAR